MITYCIHNKQCKIQYYSLQLAAQLTFNICMTKKTYYHHIYLKLHKSHKNHNIPMQTLQNIKCIHTTRVTTHLTTMKINRLIQTTAPSINISEASLTKTHQKHHKLNSEQINHHSIYHTYTKSTINTIHYHSVPFVTHRYMTSHLHTCAYTADSSGVVDEQYTGGIIVN